MKLRSTFQLIATLLIAASAAVQAQGLLPRERGNGSLPPAGAYNDPNYRAPGMQNQGYGAPAGSLNGTPMSPYGGMSGVESIVTASDPNRKLQAGDVLSLRIEEDRELPVDIAVSPSGEVIVEPLPQSIKVTSMTVAAAGQEIKRQLEKDYYHNATVRLSLKFAGQGANGYVSLSGYVARVGEFPLPAGRTMTVSKAINASGGFARYADERKVQLLRTNKDGSTQKFVVDCKEINSKGRVDLDIPLQDGDRINVKDTFVH